MTISSLERRIERLEDQAGKASGIEVYIDKEGIGIEAAHKKVSEGRKKPISVFVYFGLGPGSLPGSC